MAADMLVRLYDMPQKDYTAVMEEQGIQIKRAFIGDKPKVMAFVRENFSEGWAMECECAMLQQPSTCYIAVKDKEVIGFACYDATAKNFFGPTGVKESMRGKKIGAALLHACMHSIKEQGYAYAIIGWVDDARVFYEKEVGAEVIVGAEPSKSIYANMVSVP